MSYSQRRCYYSWKLSLKKTWPCYYVVFRGWNTDTQSWLLACSMMLVQGKHSGFSLVCKNIGSRTTLFLQRSLHHLVDNTITLVSMITVRNSSTPKCHASRIWISSNLKRTQKIKYWGIVFLVHITWQPELQEIISISMNWQYFYQFSRKILAPTRKQFAPRHTVLHLIADTMNSIKIKAYTTTNN